MKTILVPVGGTKADLAVFETAYAAARAFHAHLEFVHVRIDVAEAVRFLRHADYTLGPNVRATFELLEQEAKRRSGMARDNVEEFRRNLGIPTVDTPRATTFVSASWHEYAGEATSQLLLRARHNDLVVLGRAARPNGLPPDFVERVLLGAGRPILLAPQRAPQGFDGTVMICWKETAEAARAVTAALPFLKVANRVVVVAAEEAGGGTAEGAADVARQLAWHGIAARSDFIAAAGRPVAAALTTAARAHGADLLVMGGYGHSRLRETIFGGFTQSVLEGADLAVFLLH